MTEISAPSGYQLIQKPIWIKIQQEHTEVIVKNDKLASILSPNTGSNNSIKYSGLILIFGAYIFISSTIVKKRLK